ncbi:response regulator [Cohnella sp. CFH 77786]|uniref:ATP-binding protein n=1 Tax=Cohnella sp. CFH 77786 TaxID=2662265 RepID=UPI001C60FFB6|nr:ATP-binding protein [Cohnella sp. CFH 77786]MBW5447976.1 response regulator [Cohnella sp. CFH 77786]
MLPAKLKKWMRRLGLVLLLVTGWTVPILFLSENGNVRTTDLSASPEWQFHEGDLPLSVVMNPQSISADWTPLRETDKRLSKPGYYWLKIDIRSEPYRDPHLFINDLRHYEAYYNGKLLIESNFADRDPRMLEYYEWNLVSFSFGYPAEPLLLRVYSDDGVVKTGTIRVGNAADFIVRILHKDGDKLLFGVIFTLLSVVAALFYFNTRKKMYFYFSLLAFCAAYASICRTFALGLFVDAPSMIYYHELMLPLGSFAFNGFFHHLYGVATRFHRSARYCMLAFTFICFGVGFWDNQAYHTLLFYVFPVLFLILIFSSMRMHSRIHRGQRSKESVIIIFGYAVSNFSTFLSSMLLLFPSLRTYLQHHVPWLTPYVRDDQLPVFTGMFIFLCCMGTIVLMRENEVHRQVHGYSRELEEKNRKLEEIDKLKDEFLANTSHELRTPLNGIIGITESLLEGVAGPLNELARSNLSMVVSSGKRLSGLINDILDFSKLKHSGVALFIQGVDLKRSADGVANVLQPLAQLKDIRLANRIDDRLPLAAADENRVQQILYNLVGNALKFTEQGYVEITAHVDGPWIYVSVSDSGIGIPADKMEAIFEPFEQGEGSAAREYGGAGLGLAISKKLVELHGGSLGLVSVPGRGSTFTFTLPIGDPNLQAPSPAVAQPRAAAPLVAAAVERTDPLPLEEEAWTRRETCLLLVDDDPVNLQVLTNFLSTQPYSILKAAGGVEALRMLEQGIRPDLVLTDLMMPRMTGYELSRKIRERYKPSELPIIMLTAKNQVTDLVEGFDAGANDYLIKPVAKRELLARIELHLQLSELTESLERKVQERTRELHEKNVELQAAMQETAQALAEASILEERNRISFEIHNTVGHTLTACIAQMEAAKMLIAHGRTELALPKLDTSRELVSKGLNEIRESIRMLKLESTDENLSDKLMRLIRETEESAGVRIEADIAPLPALGSFQKKTIYHALMEGLTNGIRHGGSASFTFTLTHGNGKMYFRLSSDGEPVPEGSAFGFGLSAMDDNVRRMGGQLTLESTGERGTLLSIDIPLDWRTQSKYVEEAGR